MTLLPVVAIDGPVGVGKSSVARSVAARLGFLFIDTGAMYRTVALRALALSDGERTPAALGRIARETKIDLRQDGRVLADGEDISSAIRDEHVSRHVYLAADDRGVREALVEQQRRMGREQSAVLEGRDITTVVFPDARWKLYLDASPRVRAGRRVAQLAAAGRRPNTEQVFRDLLDRDARDRARPWGALSIARDATIIDTTGLDESTVVDLIVGMVRAGLGNPLDAA